MVGRTQLYANAWAGNPTNDSGGDTAEVTLALRMQTAVAGSVLGARFFRDLADGGEHVAFLYAAADLSILDAAVFHKVVAAGAGAGSWQSVYFRKAHRFAAADRFVIGVRYQGGLYWLNPGALASAPVVNGDLSITADGDAGSNGLFNYGSFIPTSTFGSTQYAVDCIFLPS